MVKRSLSIYGSFLLILAAVCCAIGALISAFSFRVNAQLAFFVWLCAAIALTATATRWRVKGILALTLPVLAIILWRLPEIIEGAKWVIFYITSEYNKWLHVPVFFSGADAMPNEVTLFFIMAGTVLAFFITIAICLQRSVFLTLFFTAPIIFLTVVLTESTPDVRFFMGLIAVYLTLIISGSLQPGSDIAKNVQSVFPALSLSMFLICIAYIIALPGSYTRGNFIGDIDSYLRRAAERTGLDINKKGTGWPAGIPGQWRFDTEHVGVADAGSRIITDQSILEITATRAGTLYLKGFSMQSFNGRDWRLSSDTHPLNALPNAMPALIADVYSHLNPARAPAGASLTINQTGDSSNVPYQPYYSLPLASNISIIRTTDDSRSMAYQVYYGQPHSQTPSYPYTVDYFHIENSVSWLSNAFEDSYPYLADYYAQMRVQPVYTQIEDSTAEGLRRLALDAGIDPNAGRAAVADMVADYVSSAARYTLTPYIIPDGEDFTLHFLQTSKRGYCIHFATAATLMLRALDIPARFTSGFAVTITAENVGNTVVLTDRNAHAWVEVYYDYIGWIPLEVTPPHPGIGGIFGGMPHSGGGSGVAVWESSGEYYDEIYPDDYYEFYYWEDLHLQGLESSAASGAQGGSDSTGPIGRIIIVASCIAAAIAAVAIRRSVARKRREKRFAQQDTNAAVIYAWRYITRLSRWDNPPKETEDMALKARFSQHRITEEERTIMIDKALEYAAVTYRRHDPHQRLWLKYIRGL